LTVPPPVFDAFAVKVRGVLEHTVVLGLTTKFTEGIAAAELTVIVTPFEMAVAAAKQVVPPVIVTAHVTKLPLASVVLVKVFDVLF
jgi:hypothetical protein